MTNQPLPITTQLSQPTEDEVWSAISGYEGLYEVSTHGNVRSIDRVISSRDGRKKRLKGMVLKQNKSGSGYNQVVLSKSGSTWNTSVHRLVAAAFIGVIPDGMDVCHNDGDKTNNLLSNIRIDTRKNNMADSVSHGTSPRGERNAGSVLTEAAVIDMRSKYATGLYKSCDLAKEFGVSKEHVSAVLVGNAWKWAGGEIKQKSTNRGADIVTSKLIESDVKEIRRLSLIGDKTRTEIARMFGVSPAAVYLIMKGKNWAHV